LDFDVLSSLIAGFLATVMMTLATEVAALRGATSMPSVPLLLGGFISGDHDLAMTVGSALHYVVIGTVVNGAIYALVFSLIGAGLIGAALIGMVHGVLIGVGLGWLRQVHPRVVDGSEVKGGALGFDDGGEIAFSDPGLFGVGWGDKTPVVVMGACGIYSVTFALVYSLAV
jgi:hypothetical protein